MLLFNSIFSKLRETKPVIFSRKQNLSNSKQEKEGQSLTITKNTVNWVKPHCPLQLTFKNLKTTKCRLLVLLPMNLEPLTIGMSMPKELTFLDYSGKLTYFYINVASIVMIQNLLNCMIGYWLEPNTVGIWISNRVVEVWVFPISLSS